MTNRRQFFRQLLAAVGVTAAFPVSAVSRSDKREVFLLETSLAGYEYYRADQLVPQLQVFQPLVLKREIENSHDTRAVAVYWQDQKLGYIPRGDNAGISQMLDRNEQLHAVISKLELSANTWERISIRIILTI